MLEFKRWILKKLCPHESLVSSAKFIIKKTVFGDDKKTIHNRTASCVVCGRQWDGIKDWKTFKPSPGEV